MYFKQILNERCGCASYVIASRRTLEAAVVDAASDTEPYTALLREREFRLRHVIDTHIHADHVSGARRLAAAHGAELCLHESARTTYPFERGAARPSLVLDLPGWLSIASRGAVSQSGGLQGRGECERRHGGLAGREEITRAGRHRFGTAAIHRIRMVSCRRIEL